MNKYILLVEDDPVAQMALGKTLESAGYAVDTAADGETALRRLQQAEYDVVVSDIRLPDRDGLTILRAAMEQQPAPSVLILTGYGTLDTAIEALRGGACDYLLKPCSPQTLLDGVATALRRRTATLQQAQTIRSLAQGVAQLQQQLLSMASSALPAVEPTPPPSTADMRRDLLVVGQLQIGRFPYEVRYRNQPLHLTPIEHALLRCLAESAGQVVNYTDLVRYTHGYSASESEAQVLLKSHVRNLRRKTGADLIVNVRHAGYRLVQVIDEASTLTR
ncbi:MAG: response regulator transcription factor [Chloroflexaceae bacterium]|jgi:DNA-binding response OmpR family regulator|nr:response regulator transcription factor [Chloroflexaceae bacterium]